MAAETAEKQSFAVRHHFLLRRLHSLSGIVPVGVFLIMHLTVNASINVGADVFEENVERIHALGPLLIPVEIVGIFIPILFHALLGFQIWFSGQPNTGAYSYGGNFRYMLQRVTGGIAFVFILYHLWHMHWLGNSFGGGFFDHRPGAAASTAAEAMQMSIWAIPVSVLYAIGVIASVYHFSNGIWTSLITWGITVGPSSQRIAGYACAMFGIVLGLVGLSSVRGFAKFDANATTETASHADSVDSNETLETQAG